MRTKLIAALTLAAVVHAQPAAAFLFPEHSRITQAALEDLAVDRDVGPLVRALVVSPELCQEVGDINEWDCLRLVADLSALAGDHSCSPDELVSLVRAAQADHEHWLWDVRRAGWEADALLNGDSAEGRRRLKVIDIETKGVAEANETLYRNDRRGVDAPQDRDFYRRRINVQFQKVDAQYQSRAIVDGGHFQLGREPGRIDLADYLRQVLSPHAATNATALYAAYHILALRLASRNRQAAFLTELFALHFLEDSFSSGHIVGNHGLDTPLLLKSEGVRMGTHDHYSDEGVETPRWRDLAAPYVVHGDGEMKPNDLRSAALAAQLSLREVLLAMQDPALSARAAAFPVTLTGAFDSCSEAHPLAGLALLPRDALADVLSLEPVPSPQNPEPPRFRTETGFFFGGMAAIDGGGATSDGGVGRAHAGIRGGIGMNGLMTDPMNSIMFAEVGIVALGTHLGRHASADAGITFRLRSPGMVTLVDGAIVMSLLAAGVRPPWLLALGSMASEGGLVPFLWESHHITGPWNFQVSALRDAAFNLYFRDTERFRWEFQAPLMTLRTANPMSGISWAQSNDFWMDIGFSAGRATEVPNGTFGFYLSLGASARTFP